MPAAASNTVLIPFCSEEKSLHEKPAPGPSPLPGPWRGPPWQALESFVLSTWGQDVMLLGGGFWGVAISFWDADCLPQAVIVPQRNIRSGWGGKMHRSIRTVACQARAYEECALLSGLWLPLERGDGNRPARLSPQVLILLYIADWMVHWMWGRGLDPDNFSIPYLTALGDLLGTGLLALSFHVLWLIGDRDTDVGD